MESIALDHGLKLSFEKLPHTIRLIILMGDEELVCRKARLSTLFSFAEIDEGHLFKGRLRLFKFDGAIGIHIKDELISIVSNESFQQALIKSQLTRVS